MYLIRVRWSGFSELEDTYEPFSDLISQVPILVIKFLHEERICQWEGFELFLQRENHLLTTTCTKLGLELPIAIRH